MSRPPLPFDLPLDRLRIVGWPDPVLDAVGHELHSAYVERFWLPVLGPSTTWLARLLARGLDADPEGFDLDLDATAAALGLGTKRGTNSPFLRSLARAGHAAAYGMMAHVPLRGMVKARVLDTFAAMYRAGGGALALDEGAAKAPLSERLMARYVQWRARRG